jgi:hypothetical protein
MEEQKKINLSNACHYSHKSGSRKCMSDSFIEKYKAKSNNIEFNNNLDKLLASKGATIEELGFLLDKRTIGIVGKQEIMKELQDNFKPVGPVNNELFSNFVIDNAISNHLSTLDDTFLGLDVNLMDFPDYKGSLMDLIPTKTGIEYKGREYTHFGCVLNTLVMKGDIRKVGHWVALYGDFRNDKLATLEYFNSSGNNPPKSLKNWMSEFAEKSTQVRGIPCKDLVASNVVHQKSETECGIYAMYYIVSRFIGIDYKKFREARIPDDHVNKFRSKMFNDQKKVNSSLLEEYRLL